MWIFTGHMNRKKYVNNVCGFVWLGICLKHMWFCMVLDLSGYLHISPARWIHDCFKAFATMSSIFAANGCLGWNIKNKCICTSCGSMLHLSMRRGELPHGEVEMVETAYLSYRESYNSFLLANMHIHARFLDRLLCMCTKA